MYRVGVIGDRDSVMGFRALGLYVMVAEDRESILRHLEAVLDDGFAVVYITEHAAVLVPEELEAARTRKIPAFVPIPSTRGTLGIGMAQVKDTVKKAVGVDILGFDRATEGKETDR
jgi:V/A-type H+-transporting ATPase subunit F